MAITYDVPSKIITVTGYTEGVPCTFTDLYNADKAGTLSLHDRDGVSAVDGAPVSTIRALRPADYKELGGACNDLYIVIANWTNMTTATIRVVGEDRCGNAVTEDVVVTGNGNYNLSEKFAVVNTTQVTVFTQSDAGSFDYELIQGQWGVVSKQGDAQFLFDCKLYIGDGSTETWFADTEKEVTFSEGIITAAWQFLIDVRRYANFRVGNLDDAGTKRTSRGCQFISLTTGYNYYFYRAAFAAPNSTQIYSSSFKSLFFSSVYIRTNAKVYNCHFDWQVSFTIWQLTNDVDVYNCHKDRMSPTAAHFHIYTSIYNFEKNSAVGAGRLIYTADSAPFTVRDLYGRAYTYLLAPYNWTTDGYIIDADVDVWNFLWLGTCTGKAYRQYSFDLKVVDVDGAAINGATVTLYDKNNNQVFQVTTDASGEITTQTVSRGYYDQAHGDTLQDYTPHTLIIEKAGFQTYQKKFTLEAKTAWEIKLTRIVDIIFVDGKVALNLDEENPESELYTGI